MSAEANSVEFAVALGRVEEKVGQLSRNRENDIAFQQSVRDSFTDHEKRITTLETSTHTMKWLFTVSTPVMIFAATWVSNLLATSD